MSIDTPKIDSKGVTKISVFLEPPKSSEDLFSNEHFI